jgi:hypothetical protein
MPAKLLLTGDHPRIILSFRFFPESIVAPPPSHRPVPRSVFSGNGGNGPSNAGAYVLS